MKTFDIQTQQDVKKTKYTIFKVSSFYERHTRQIRDIYERKHRNKYSKLRTKYTRLLRLSIKPLSRII